MATKNATAFLEEVNANPTLKEKLSAGAANTGAWISAAASAGYEFTVEELRSATEALLGKSLNTEQLVGELHALFEGELGDESLDAVTGGANTSGASTPKVVVKVATVRGQVNRGSTVADDGYVGERSPIFAKEGFGGKGGSQIGG